MPYDELICVRKKGPRCVLCRFLPCRDGLWTDNKHGTVKLRAKVYSCKMSVLTRLTMSPADNDLKLFWLKLGLYAAKTWLKIDSNVTDMNQLKRHSFTCRHIFRDDINFRTNLCY